MSRTQILSDMIDHTAATVASAATCDIGATTSDRVTVSGTTTITSFGAKTNRLRFVVFSGALILTHNATSLILPAGANITTAAGDTATLSSDGSGNWTCLSYQRKDGSPLVNGSITAAVLAALKFGPFTALASAATADLSTIGTIGVSITGTTTITSFGAGVSLFRIVKFAGALTLTHNATSLILPGGANITTAAGDTAVCLSDASGNWTVVSYSRANGTALVAPSPGKIVARYYAEYTTNADLATTIPGDDTIPQNTEGTQILTVTLTPASVSNLIRVRFAASASGNGGGAHNVICALFRDSGANALAARQVTASAGSTYQYPLSLEFEDAPATISSVTYKIRVGSDFSTIRLNGSNTARTLGGTQRATLIVEEIAP